MNCSTKSTAARFGKQKGNVIMSNNEAKLVATLGVWTAFTIVAVTAMIRDLQMSSFMGAFLALLLVAGAVVATGFVWRAPAADEIEASEKSKRRTRVDRMVDRLSHQELEELRARLMADGEQVSLDELMQYRERG
jgi:hypothetical protein